MSVQVTDMREHVHCNITQVYNTEQTSGFGNFLHIQLVVAVPFHQTMAEI